MEERWWEKTHNLAFREWVTWNLHARTEERKEEAWNETVGKIRVSFPQINKCTIYMNSTLNGNIRQNTEYKIMTAKAENNTK